MDQVMEEPLDRIIEEEGTLEAAILPLRDMVVFPRMATPIIVGRDKSLRAVEAAVQREEPLVALTQRDGEIEDPTPEDLYTVGTLVSVARVLRMPDGTVSVLVQGQQRVQVVGFTQQEPYLRAVVRPIFERADRPPAVEALMRAVLSQFERVVQLDRAVPEDAYVFAMNIDEPGWLADLIASTLNLKTAERQELLEIFEPSARLLRLSILLARLLDVLELESKIQAQVQQEVDRSQREFYLREQMKAIQHELGEVDVYTQEINELRERLEAKNLPEEVRARAEKEL
ncbi:MAG TPA: LON peptidase substrate-binding domain-containing protein, partial [Thermoflexus sp.]|nr:LON peptidase substrate-binding domain-containing protein [Thermoflexus sp.]